MARESRGRGTGSDDAPGTRSENVTALPDRDTGTALTVRQQRILEVIRTQVERRGYPPSIREIGDEVGLTSTSSVAHQLRTLERRAQEATFSQRSMQARQGELQRTLETAEQQTEALLEERERAQAEQGRLNDAAAQGGLQDALALKMEREQAVATARSRSQTANDLWGGHAAWQVVPATGSEWEPVSPTGLLIHDTLTARLHPRHAADCLIAAIRAMGGQVTVGDAPDEGAVVWATGLAGLMDLSVALGRKVGTGVKGQALLLRHDAAKAPQLFADALHIVPHADGTVAIGSTSENEWRDPATTDAGLDALHARAVAACPALTCAPVVERWAGVRPRTKSRAPMLGAWPGRPGQFIANGGFKIGFGMAPKVAETMVDLVLEGRDTIPPGFRVEASL